MGHRYQTRAPGLGLLGCDRVAPEPYRQFHTLPKISNEIKPRWLKRKSVTEQYEKIDKGYGFHRTRARMRVFYFYYVYKSLIYTPEMS